MIDVGELALWVALSFAVWSVVASAAAVTFDRPELAHSAARGLIAAAAALLVAAIVLWAALLARDFSVRYVASVTSDTLPARYAFAAFWGGRTGAVFLLALLLSAVAARLAASTRPTQAGHIAAVAIAGLVLSGLLALLSFDGRPFDRLEWGVRDGLGLNPVLQHPGMLLHPPLLALGSALTVPALALALGAAIAGHWTRRRAQSVRRWSVAAWVTLGASILCGMWWAHRSGVQSSWLWDPIGHGALWPWLLILAGLSVGMRAERRARGARIPLALFASAALVALPLTMVTWNGVGAGWWRVLRSPGGWMLAANVVLAVGFTTAVICARVPAVGAPIESRRSLRVPLVLLGVGSASFALAAAGTMLRRGHDLEIAPGRAASVVDPFRGDWRFASQGLSRYDAGNKRITVIPLAATIDGRARGLLASERQQFLDRAGDPRFAPITQPAIRSGPLQDVVVFLGGVERETGFFRIEFHPFVLWAWIGGVLVLAGGALLFWPRSADEMSTVGLPPAADGP